MKTQQITLWIARIVAAIIMLQTLFFKFTAQPESVYIFSKVGIEPYGRIGTGIMELIASFLILYPRTSWFGAIMGIGIMAGAVVTHLFILGIEVQGDGGQLFSYAIITLISCLVVAWLEKDKVYSFLQNLQARLS